LEAAWKNGAGAEATVPGGNAPLNGATDESGDAAVDEFAAQRARLYGLLATLLARPPDRNLLTALAGLTPDASPIGRALGRLRDAAGEADPFETEREYNRLFIGLQRGELVPYASFYLTGFLQDRPLIRVREDMARLGLERAPDVAEPEDHAAALLEMMGALAEGALDAAPEEEARFFERHCKPWLAKFFRDLERADSARFYRPVGALGRLFMEIEAEAFALADA